MAVKFSRAVREASSSWIPPWVSETEVKYQGWTTQMLKDRIKELEQKLEAKSDWVKDIFMSCYDP